MDYKITVRLFGREVIGLAVDTPEGLNGSKPLLFIGIFFITALVAGVMFLSLFLLAMSPVQRWFADVFAVFAGGG